MYSSIIRSFAVFLLATSSPEPTSAQEETRDAALESTRSIFNQLGQYIANPGALAEPEQSDKAQSPPSKEENAAPRSDSASAWTTYTSVLKPLPRIWGNDFNLALVAWQKLL